MRRPVVFTGSSTEGLHIARQVQQTFESLADCRPWTHGEFGLSQGTLESLIDATKESDFAVLVLTPDDLASKKGKKAQIPRDHVVFEIGLFMGAIGRDRTVIVHGRDAVISRAPS